MGPSIVAAFFVFVSGALAYRANARFRDEDRLPMQWWFTGEVTWSAPRRLALSLMPALAAVTLGALAITSLTTPPRAGQEGAVLPAAIGMGAMLVAIQSLHLRLVARTLRRAAR
jgi:hypothetical protein